MEDDYRQLLERIYSPITYSNDELGTFAALTDILNRLLVLKPKYWRTLLAKSPRRPVDWCLYFVQYATVEAQATHLRKIATLLNKSVVPGDDLYDQIPAIGPLPLTEFLKEYRTHHPTHPAIADQFQAYFEAKRPHTTNYIVVYAEASKIGPEAVNRLMFAGLDHPAAPIITPDAIETLEREAPEFVEYLHRYRLDRADSQVDLEDPATAKRLFESIGGVAGSHKCANCHQTGAMKRCTGCGRTYYCSVEHQRANWPVHRAVCKMFRAFGLYISSLQTKI